jgi:hypothetical protein
MNLKKCFLFLFWNSLLEQLFEKSDNICSIIIAHFQENSQNVSKNVTNLSKLTFISNFIDIYHVGCNISELVGRK